MKKIATSVVFALTTSAAFAQDVIIGDGKSESVPEISALEGTAALAAVAAIVLLAWERRRRAS